MEKTVNGGDILFVIRKIWIYSADILWMYIQIHFEVRRKTNVISDNLFMHSAHISEGDGENLAILLFDVLRK